MEFSALRKAAIRLACSHAEDRDWILARLKPDERRKVEELLDEINDLGLTSDPNIVTAMMSELPAPLVTPNNVRLKVQLSRSTHPFWGGLVLQTETPLARREVLGNLANSAEIRRWDSKFAKLVLPPALMASLKARMDFQEAGDEQR